jgi:hypothetical protein
MQDVGGQDRPFADEALARVEYRPALSAPPAARGRPAGSGGGQGVWLAEPRAATRAATLRRI